MTPEEQRLNEQQISDFNNPNVKITGSKSDYAQQFNDPNVKIQPQLKQPGVPPIASASAVPVIQPTASKKYINTAKNEFYDLTDPNAPKLLGNMKDYGYQLGEQDFQNYLEDIASKKLASPTEGWKGREQLLSSDWWKTFEQQEKNAILPRFQGDAVQRLLKETEMKDLTPTAPAPEQPVVKSGFDITPGQASPEQIARFKAGEGEYATDKVMAALAEKSGEPAEMKTQGTTPYYGTLQDLANGGLQVSGGKVYENGQIIGTYGGVSPAAAPNDGTAITTQPGQGEVVKLSSGQSVVRNLEKEKAALAEYGKIYGKMPSTSDDWTKLHDLAYSGDKKAVIPPNYEKIGHPDQISQYEDVQRVGKVGEPGSYLYGKKKTELPNEPAPSAAASSPTSAAPGTASPAALAIPAAPAIPASAETADPYRQKLLDMITQMSGSQKDYLDYLKSQPTATDTYTKLREQLGLSAKEKGLEGIRGQVAETESLLDKLEDDINSRISGKGISEALRRRLLASEGSPLREQLADLVKGQGLQEQSLSGTRQQLADMMTMSKSDQEQAAKIAGLPAENLKSLLPLYESAYTYQSPTEKARADLAASLAKETALKAGGLGSYYEEPKTATDYDTTMLKEGYNYVSTPAERDRLKAKGYTITTLGGRTYAKAPEKASGADKGSLSVDEKAFYSDVNSISNDLANGKKDWAQAFNYIKSKYGTPDDIIDNLLNKDVWAVEGAYEKQLKSRKEAGATPNSDEELLNAFLKSKK